MSFGRDKKSNDIHISNLNISRTHFSIVFKASNYMILDNDSTNGMIINGYKLKSTHLKHGDIIEIGDATFIFYL
jgi:pSer/pThr/pTyr-binding forkhead associated (FHA) protein